MIVVRAARTLPLLLLLLQCLPGIGQTTATELAPGLKIEKRLSPGDAHDYSVPLAANDFLSVLVLKKEVSVTITLSSPALPRAASAGSAHRRFGPERILYLAPGPDTYTVRVTGGDAGASGGGYELRVLRLGPATEEDRSQLAAEALMQEAEKLEKDRRRSDAEEKLKKAVDLERSIGDKLGQANALSALADVVTDDGRDGDAIPLYSEAAKLFQEQDDPFNEGANLYSRGINQLAIGEKDSALESLKEALALFEATDSKAEQAIALHQIGRTYWALGERQKVLDYFERALAIHKSTGDQAGEARTLNSIGAFYYNINDNDRALDYFQRALKIDRRLGQSKQVAVTLYNVGERFRYLRDYSKALSSFEEALPLARANGDRATEARILGSIGAACAATGQMDRAIESVNSSVDLAKGLQDSAAEAEALSKAGDVLGKAGREDEGLDRLHQSLELDRVRGYAPGEALTLFRIALIERKNGKLEDAREHIEAALGIVEGVWSHLASPEWGALYLSGKRDLYDLYVDILMALHQRDPNAGFAAAAFAAAERMRARSFLDLLTEAKVDLRSELDPELLARQKSLTGSIEKAVRAQNSPGRSTRDQAEKSGREVSKLLEEYDSIEARLRQSSPRYAALAKPEPVNVERVQQELDSDTVLLEYNLAAGRSYVWVLARDRVSSFSLPPGDSIGNVARTAYASLEKEGAISPAMRELSGMLLRPMVGELRQKRIVVVADGPLDYIPFAMLSDPDQPKNPLLARHEIVHLPSASTLLVLRQTQKQAGNSRLLAIFADPVFDTRDSRIDSAASRSVTDAGLGMNLPRLPFTRQEAQAIAGLVPAAGRMEALDFEATRALLLSKDLGRYQMLHLATHAIVNTEHPELSGIVLSQVDKSGNPIDGVVRLLDLYQMRLAANLVVLSACETALGKQIRGEGLVGLTRGFMYAGAPRVVASLWKVNDRATAELMRLFYQRMLGPAKMRPAAALRSAQLALSQQPRWRSPYYWAAFVLQGEWQ